MYKLTNEGKNVLNFAENSLRLMVKNMASDNKIQVQAPPVIYAGSTLQRENPMLTVCWFVNYKEKRGLNHDG